MAYRIKHVPTGLYFGKPDASVSGCINHLKNVYIDINYNEFKAGTSGRGRGKIWTRKLYVEKTLKELQEVTKPEDWKLEEF